METVWEFIKQISNNPLWTLGSFIVAFISVILVIILHKRGQRTKKPTFLVRSSNLVSDFSSKFAKLQILYSSREIENLTVSKIAFWNDGAQTIDSRDVAEADPLRIVLKEEYNILDVSVIYTKNEANRFGVLPFEEGRSVKITFDYLDKDEGGVIQLIHTGKGSSDIEVSGIVKGVGKAKSRHTRPQIIEIIGKILPAPKPSKAQTLRARRIIGITLFGVAIFLVVVAFTTTKTVTTTVVEELLIRIFGFIGALLYVYMGYMLLKRRVPQGFETVEEEI